MKWISVNDSLPPLRQRVLVVAELPGFRKSVFISKRIPHDTANPDNPRWHWTQVANDDEVKYWCPFPKLPQ